MDRAAFAERYARVKASIPSHVTLVAVSKTRTVEEIRALYDLGHRAFGENYPQELRDKQALLPSDIEWHFIGHLQSNKVKYVAGLVHLIHGIDRPGLLYEVDKRAAGHGRVQDVLLQVHIAREETKHGMTATEVMALLKDHPNRKWEHIRIVGLMGMASNTEDHEQVHGEFRGLATLFEQACEVSGGLGMLSMGMSADAALAISAGSNLVRIGTAIFGERTYQ